MKGMKKGAEAHNPKGVGQKCGVDGKLMYQFAGKTQAPSGKARKQ